LELLSLSPALPLDVRHAELLSLPLEEPLAVDALVVLLGVTVAPLEAAVEW
jgi:hypothetical protein